MKLNNICKLINNEIIILKETNLNHTYPKGIYFSIPRVTPTIGMEEPIVSYSFIHISVSSKELGHHFKASYNFLNDSTNYIREFSVIVMKYSIFPMTL